MKFNVYNYVFNWKFQFWNSSCKPYGTSFPLASQKRRHGMWYDSMSWSPGPPLPHHPYVPHLNPRRKILMSRVFCPKSCYPSRYPAPILPLPWGACLDTKLSRHVAWAPYTPPPIFVVFFVVMIFGWPAR